MNLSTADHIAGQIVGLLRPHCHRIEIAGSIRRRRPEPNYIEVVAIAVDEDGCCSTCGADCVGIESGDEHSDEESG